jgi:hypothetical protein
VRKWNIKTEEFNSIYNQLNRYEDIARLSSELGMPEELLLVIYTQRTVRRATRDFYKIKAKTIQLADMWKHGMSFYQIGRKFDFPPVLTAMLITQHLGISKKGFRKMVQEPDKIENARYKTEMAEVLEKDILYSPKGLEVQVRRGKKGEAALQSWLKKKCLTFRTEEDLRGQFQKTPDILLDKPIFVRGDEVKWIESKASFGDLVEIKKNLKNQLIPYSQIFGPGLVIYWFGTITETPPVPGVLIENPDFLRSWEPC